MGYCLRLFPPGLFAVALGALALGCGDPAGHQSETARVVTAAEVGIAGRIASPGTRGSIVVFAFTDLPPQADLADREPASLGSVGSGGEFALTVPPGQTLTLAFLADGSSDGVIDPGDPVAILDDPQQQLTDLQAGDQVQLADLTLNFVTRQASGTIEVARAGVPPAKTPTQVP